MAIFGFLLMWIGFASFGLAALAVFHPPAIRRKIETVLSTVRATRRAASVVLTVGALVAIGGGAGMVDRAARAPVVDAADARPFRPSASMSPARAAVAERARAERARRRDTDDPTVGAGFICDGPVERLARYSHRWTDGWGPKFSRYRWVERGKVATVYGDRIEFQNGFGAWQRQRYECTYDVTTRRVLDASTSPF